jgi:stringent starvation protein B
MTSDNQILSPESFSSLVGTYDTVSVPHDYVVKNQILINVKGEVVEVNELVSRS